jgi:hypothetical protein
MWFTGGDHRFEPPPSSAISVKLRTPRLQLGYGDGDVDGGWDAGADDPAAWSSGALPSRTFSDSIPAATERPDDNTRVTAAHDAAYISTDVREWLGGLGVSVPGALGSRYSSAVGSPTAKGERAAAVRALSPLSSPSRQTVRGSASRSTFITHAEAAAAAAAAGKVGVLGAHAGAMLPPPPRAPRPAPIAYPSHLNY